MKKERIYLFDTTLRDGQQTPGVDFSVEDKIAIAGMLDAFGIDYVEGGYPGANPTDTAFFKRKRTACAKFVAFGMTKRAGVSASNDPWPGGAHTIELRRCLFCRQELGLSCANCARLHQ
jgi:2-isopropylmalate synthase